MRCFSLRFPNDRTEETASCSHRRKGDSREKSIPTMNSADELTHIHPRQTTVSPETMDDGAARNQASSRSHSDGISQKSHPRVNWNNAELKRILSDYRERGIGSTRQVAQQISALTGIYVSHSTICRQSRSQTGCNEWVPRQSLADTGVGIAAYRERSFKEDEENEGDASTSTRHSWSVSDQGAEMRMPIKHSKNGPLRTPPTVPYYMSFSERFKQTSLTVHLNADEVRIYRHTSHSRDCRSIYFRCSRCDNINRKLRTGITPRIKMMDGVVVGDLFPEHHPRCIPMSIVAARALEIERRCRKDIINGMDPKEAWQKGRLAAIAESATLGSSVYGPGTVTAAFPDWERCRRLYCTLRGKTLRRRLKNELFDPKRIVLNDPDRPNSHAPRNGVDEISQFDVSEPPRPKRPSFEHQCEWNAEAIHDRGNTHDEEDCMAVEDEVLDEELDESYMNEFAESDDEIYGEIVGEKIDDQFVVEREEIVTSSSLRTDHVKTNVYSNVSSPQPHAGQVVMDMNDKDLQTSKRRQNEHAVCSQTSDSVPSTSSNASAVRGADDRRRKTMSTHVQQVRYEETPPIYETRRKETSEFVSEDGRPRRLIRPARKLSPMPTASASAHAALPPTLKRSTTPILQRKLIREADTGESREANSCVRVITPAGMIPMNIKREEKFAHGEAAEKLRQIERLIAEYNLRSGDKLASVLVRRNGHMKMFGSKALIAASLHSPFYQSLRNAANSKRFFEADEMISLPLIKVRTASEVDVMHDAMMRPMLSDFITQSHFPTVHSFDAIRVPDYWPDDVFYCDPDREHANFINAAKRQQFRSFNSVVDGQRHVLKYAYQSYSDFLMSHFDAACIPGMESDVRVEFEEHCESDRTEGTRTRYSTMLEDVETIAKHMGNIQRKSACRAMAVFADERYNLVASGDKTLIAALFSSNINPCLRLSAAKKLDKEPETIPLLRVFDETEIDQMTGKNAVDAVDNAMSHINFPWLDPYDGERPQYWPQEIPFRSPSADDGTGISTAIQAAKVVLKNVRWFQVEKVLNEKLQMNQPSSDLPPNFMAETADDSDTRKSERVHAPSKSTYDGLTPSSRSHLPIQQPLAKQQLPAEDGFLKVFCRCGGNVEISSRDCHYCDRCVCYYHDSCLPLKEVDRFLLCFKCAPLQG